MRKLLTFKTEAGEAVRVLWTNGECRTPAALERVLAGGLSWEGVRTSGDTTPKPALKFVAKKLDANNPEFLGLQNPPKAQPKPVEKNEDGTDKPAKRGRQAVSVDVAKMKELAPTMTIKQASEAMGISYSNLFVAAKKNGVEFVKGQRGRKKKVVAAA